MYLSLDWLKDFVAIPRSLKPDELGLLLTTHTVEIDGVENQAQNFDKVIVGEIIEVKKHPNADRLQLALVDIGGQRLSIVCGAPNIAPGQLVPVALVGASLPNGMEIKAVAVRGEKSEGMLCAEDELGLGDDHAGILILDKKAKVGQALSDYLGVKDVVFEVDNKSITHRGDLWSHYGMAREIAAFLDLEFKEYKPAKKILKPEKEGTVSVKVEDNELCPRYMAVAMDGIKVEESPDWMRQRLIAAGMRPINNIVDITNYVMLELGQPLHAFDRQRVEKIVVRRARKGETMETLDSEVRKLSPDMLLITDSEKPIAIAGVMGGANSEISADTGAIIIESANFNFISIRKTSAALALRTESSIRYEKALDPNLAETALARAVELVKKLCPRARVASAIQDVSKFELDQGPIELDLAWLRARLGQEIKTGEAVKILGKLGFAAEDRGKSLSVTVPTWRATRDITIPEDLLEEIARIYGYGSLGMAMPRVEMRTPRRNRELGLIREVKAALSGAPCFTEVYNYSFVGADLLDKLGLDHSAYLALANPVASHQALLRQSLAPNLLANVKTNQAHYDYIGIFEIGDIFLASEGELPHGGPDGGVLPYQETRLALVSAEEDAEGALNGLKAAVNHLADTFNLKTAYLATATVPNWAGAEESAVIRMNNEVVGNIDRLDSGAAGRLGIKKAVFIAEIGLPKFSALIARSGFRYREKDKYPPLIRDLAFVVKEKILYNDIKEALLSYHKLIRSVELFDVYSGENLGRGMKNMAFRILYQSDHTLTADEVDAVQKKLVKHIEDKFDAKVRDF